MVPFVLSLGYLVARGVPELSWELLTELLRGMGLAVLGLGLSIPLGLAAGIYLSEYASENLFTRLVHLGVIQLAAVPTVGHAFFGFSAFVLFFKLGTGVLAASLTLAVMGLPMMIVATHESLKAVPRGFREVSWNLGATRWQTLRQVVLPLATRGILTGVILEVSRVAGVAVPLMLAVAWLYEPLSTAVPPYGAALFLLALAVFLNGLLMAVRARLRSVTKW